MKNSLLIAFALLLACSACNKSEKDKPDSPAGPVGLLTSGTWKITGNTGTYTINGVDSTIDLHNPEPCEADNFFRFKPDGSLDIDEGPTKCMPDEPQSWPGAWELQDNNTKLMMSTLFYPEIYDLKELNANTLKIAITDTNMSGGFYTSTTTFTHQ